MKSISTPCTTRTAVRITSRIPLMMDIAAAAIKFLLGLGLVGITMWLAAALVKAPAPQTYLLAVAAGIYAIVCLTDAVHIGSTVGITK